MTAENNEDYSAKFAPEIDATVVYSENLLPQPPPLSASSMAKPPDLKLDGIEVTDRPHQKLSGHPTTLQPPASY
jgi:hypothetical protein